ncbi:putative B3 domain-containing protein [Camellia lanceoleosa]|uniref:B3 domain-containing protein n=1 Tax=Camellia lanceoleosa TaxID=1840588 RepID=A0ACC0ISQ3_9ERIC|nr:putative B3 domain-containing protein [Camellia lanceoleosa]
MDNNLGFFKVYLPPPKGPERLPIPSAFVKHVKGAIPDKAFLRNCHGKLWPVVVTKVGNQLCFKDGWVKFVEDNSVEVGNFLVFDFDGNYVFDFKLFGSTECEIKMIESSGFKVKEEKEEEEEKVKEEEEEEEDELEANALRKKTEKGKSEKSTKGLKKIKQGTNYGNKGKVTIKDKGGNKRAYRMEDEEGDELEAKTLRKKTEKGKSEKSTKGLKKINQGTNYGNKGKATIKDKGGNKRAYRMEVEDEEEETDDDDEEDDELETTTLRKKTEKEKVKKSTKGLKKINQGTCSTIKDKGGNKRAYTMEVEEEEKETDDDDEEEEDELEAKALRKKTENGKREKSTKGLKKINQDTSYGNKGKATIKDKGGNKRAYTMEVEDEEEEEEEEETDDDDDEEDELEAKILRKKTEKEKSEKSAKGLEKISQGTSYGNKGKDTIKGKGGNKRADTIAVEDDEDVFKYGIAFLA